MRLSCVFLMLGALTMTNAVADEPKKDEKKADAPVKREPVAGSSVHKDFPETVVIRVWDKGGKNFIVPVQTKARYREVKGEPRFDVWGGFGPVAVGSEITHGETVYVVMSAPSGTEFRLCVCDKKPADPKAADKKPESEKP